MRSFIRLFCLSLCLHAPGGRAETTQCVEVTGAPFTINAPGIYCLKRPLATTGTAILIEADDVTLDLNGHSLDYTTTGVSSTGRNNVVVRNGTVRGAGGSRAVSLAGSGVSGNRVEGIRAIGGGITVTGHGAVVRGNSVFVTTAPNDVGRIYAIDVSEGTGIRVSDNLIVDPASAYPQESGGIHVIHASGAAIERNIISNTAPNSAAIHYGICVRFADHTTVTANRITGMRYGITSSVANGTFTALLHNTIGGAELAYLGWVHVYGSNYAY